MKENLRINVDNKATREEAVKLLRSLNLQGFEVTVGNIIKTNCPEYQEINLPELRELARPKEYLNDKFELVVTNQPDDGWILVPDGAEYYAKSDISSASFEGFYKKEGLDFRLYHANLWTSSSYSDPKELFKILWQRENKMKTVKGRFLHQWAYEAFGRGEDVQFKRTDIKHSWQDIGEHLQLSWFGAKNALFRLKPKTIQIGERTIVKPIDVKPESIYFIASITHPNKFVQHVWTGHANDNMNFNRNLCHLTQQDAINHTDALLELMK